MLQHILPLLFMTVPGMLHQPEPVWMEEEMMPPPPAMHEWEWEEETGTMETETLPIPRNRYDFETHSRMRQRPLSRREVIRRAENDLRQRVRTDRYTRPVKRATLGPQEPLQPQ